MTADDLGAYEPYVARLERELQEARRDQAAIRDTNDRLRTSLEEARQERDDAVALCDDLRDGIALFQARIAELEAALRPIEPLLDAEGDVDCSPKQTLRALRRIAEARRALQPITDPE